MARRIITDTFLTITGPGLNVKVCRALQDNQGNVAVWWRPNTAPQMLFTITGSLQMRGKMTTTEGVEVAYRRRGVSCTWAICKGKFTTQQVAAWWPTDGTTDPASTTDAVIAAAAPAPARTYAGTVRPRKKAVTAAERRAARARAIAARRTRATVPERRTAAKAAATPVEPQPPAPIPSGTTRTWEEVAKDITDQQITVPDPTLDPTPDPQPESASVPDVDTEHPTPLLADLDITPRTLNALTAANITTLNDLAVTPPDHLTAIKGIGAKAISELNDLLTSHGHTPGGS